MLSPEGEKVSLGKVCYMTDIDNKQTACIFLRILTVYYPVPDRSGDGVLLIIIIIILLFI